jgi:small subunit ribosomal protein S6
MPTVCASALELSADVHVGAPRNVRLRKRPLTVNLYEGMFLLDSGKFAANPEDTANEIVGILEKSGAQMAAHRPWQDGKLAYAIDGHRRGMHYLAYFHLDSSKLTEVNRACKLNETIVRCMFIKHPEKLFDAMVQALTSGEGFVDRGADVPEPEGEQSGEGPRHEGGRRRHEPREEFDR